MHLAPRELDKLILHGAGFLAQKRYARGLRLNYPESVALLATQLLEFIRDGDSVANLMDKGKQVLGLDDVLPGVAELVHEVQVEGTFPDGTKLVTVHRPICRQTGDAALALHGSGLTRHAATPAADPPPHVVPGETALLGGDLLLNAGRAAILLPVVNTGDRPIQVGSHYPFFETNPALRFDRAQAFGRRLDIPSGTAVRFEPGETKTVALITIAGEQIIYGGNALTSGPLTPANFAAAMARVQAGHFAHEPAPRVEAPQ